MKYLSFNDLCKYLNKRKSWIYSHASHLGVKDGKMWIFTEEWADEYFETLKHYEKAQPRQNSNVLFEKSGD
jgi:hypothetical protein